MFLSCRPLLRWYASSKKKNHPDFLHIANGRSSTLKSYFPTTNIWGWGRISLVGPSIINHFTTKVIFGKFLHSIFHVELIGGNIVRFLFSPQEYPNKKERNASIELNPFKLSIDCLLHIYQTNLFQIITNVLSAADHGIL